MFNRSQEQLKDLGAVITTREILQQPQLWKETFDHFKEIESDLASFLDEITEKYDQVRVLFSGAGTSAYVGETILPYLKATGDSRFTYELAPTTDVVAHPESYFSGDEAVLLVSFARSGNSPESVATVDLAEQLVTDLYHLTITCAPEGKLAQNAQGNEHNFLILQPEQSNDAGFAMTSSFTCMYLTALLIFGEGSIAEKERHLALATEMTECVADQFNDLLTEFSHSGYRRLIYLGSGVLSGIARESQLKILELTAGILATQYESSLGFRHGPKSFVNDETAVIVFVSNDTYARRYDRDIIEEVVGDQIAQTVLEVSVDHGDTEDDHELISFDKKYSQVPDAYLALPFVYIGQLIGVETAIAVGNTPDTPSATGQVNRVVKGVTIYPYNRY